MRMSAMPMNSIKRGTEQPAGKAEKDFCAMSFRNRIELQTYFTLNKPFFVKIDT